MSVNRVSTLSPEGLQFIMRREGFRPDCYFDAGGHATIGYGHLIRPSEDFSTGVTTGQAQAVLMDDVKVAQSAIVQYVTAPLLQQQFDALVSIIYNIGAKHFAASILLHCVNEMHIQDAADAFMHWNKITIDGALQESVGLTQRRMQERELFLNGQYS